VQYIMTSSTSLLIPDNGSSLSSFSSDNPNSVLLKQSTFGR
jgi:hypothetical protein